MRGLSDNFPDAVKSADPAEGEETRSAHPAQIADYYAIDSLSVRFFDAISRVDPTLRGDIDLYLGRLGEPPKRILELGCGTGRIALPLAARGHAVFGVDLAEPMLRRAEAKRKKLPPEQARRVRFRLHDLLTLDLRSRFDAVLVPFYTFNHLGGREPRAQALAVIARHLRPGGTAFIHVSSPERMRQQRNFKRPGMIINFEPSKCRLEVTWNPPDLDEGRRRRTQLVEYRYFASDGSLLEASTERLNYCWFPDAELGRGAHRVGLRLRETLTSFSGEPGGEKIYILEKRSQP